jgi:hypothetical protein
MAYEDKDIVELIDEATQLPSTHRRAYPSRTSDVAEGADGLPIHVPTPETPDERFS